MRIVVEHVRTGHGPGHRTGGPTPRIGLIHPLKTDTG